ncbi:MAG TPA: C4-dicarboxylate transporter DctA [Candidatus Acidoferrales bacterium]|jgi:aerobic C4-dicarboxylate transport protein|nr:C4-dicarboxylate transporter DctA [Candidatus Acidoferrales bacterium]
MTANAAAEARAKHHRPRRWYAQLWVHVLVGMVVGIILGKLDPRFGVRMQPLGDAFIKLIRMLIAPIIFCTVVHGIARMADLARVGRVALKAIVYFEVLTTIALAIGLTAVNIWQPGRGMNVNLANVDSSAVQTYVAHPESATVTQFLTNIIPNTLMGAFTEGNVLQILLISVLCAFALTQVGDRGKPIVDFIEAASQMLFKIVAIVMWTAPIGAFGAIAFTVGKFGAGSLVSLGKLLGGFYVTCLIFVFGVLWPVAHWCGFSLLKLIRYIREELLIVLATTSSETVLPQLMTKLEDLGCEESIVGLVIPTGYSFNLDGTCLYLATTTVFLAQATNTHLGIWQQLGLLAVLLLSSKGAAGVAGAAFVVLAATIASTGTIPVASVALVLGIHRLMSEGLTPTNVVGNAVATIVVAKWENALDAERLSSLLDERLEAASLGLEQTR